MLIQKVSHKFYSSWYASIQALKRLMKHRDQGTKNRKELLSHLTSPFLCHRHILPCVEPYDSVAEEHPPTEQSHKGTGSLISFSVLCTLMLDSSPGLYFYVEIL